MASNVLSRLQSNTLFSLKGKTALVTGSAQGIGLSIARGFAYAGANVTIADINLEEATKQSELLNTELNAKVSTPIRADVTKIDDIDAMISRTIKEFGVMNIAVNNAGIVVPHQSTTQTVPEEDWDAQMDVNLKGTFRCCQQEAAYMIETGIQGRILNMASISGIHVINPSLTTTYNCTKGALCHMTRSMAVEWAPHGILVNAICPGAVETAMHQLPEIKPFKEEMEQKNPSKRMAQSYEMIGASIFLCCDANTFTTGVALPITGGMELGW